MSVDAFGASQAEVLVRIEHEDGMGEELVLPTSSAKELALALIAEAAISEANANREMDAILEWQATQGMTDEGHSLLSRHRE